MKSFATRLVAASLLLALLSPGHAAINRTNQTPLALSVDGTPCAELVQWSGGDPSASVVTASVGAQSKKHLSNVTYEPIIIEVGVPLSAALQTSLAGLCANSPATQTLLLTGPDGRQIQANNALLVEARFPALDAAVRESYRLTLVFRPGTVQTVTGGATAPAAPSGGTSSRARATASNFRVTLAGLPTTRVMRVEPFVITRAAPAAGIGTERDYAAAPGAVQIPDLSWTIAPTDAADWTTWRNDFIVQGNSTDNQEKSGAIELLSPDLQTVLLPLQLAHVGIRRFSRLPETTDAGVARYRADLYVEAMSATPGAAAAASPGTTPATEPATTPAPTPTTSSPATPAPQPATVAPEPAAGETRAPAGTKPPALEPGPAPEKAPTKADAVPSTPVIKPTAVSNPEDKGPRDPADFPRYTGTVRTSYRSNRSPAAIDETADYSGPTSSNAVMEFFEKQLRSRGWTETSRYETEYGAKGGSKIISSWTKDKRKATVTIWDMGPDNVAIQSYVVQSL